MERTEQVGLGVAATVHIALIVLLSISWPDPPPLPIENPPMAVDLIAEAAPISTAPEPASEAPAARLGEVESEVLAPVPPPPVPKVQPRPIPPPPQPQKATPVPAPRPTPRAERRPPPPTPRDTSERRRPDRPAATPPRQTAPARTTTPSQRNPRPAAGDPLGKIVEDVARTSTPNARGTAAPATQTAAQLRQSFQGAIDQEIAPRWRTNVPTGIDIEELRLLLEIRLNRDGSVASIRQVSLTGQTESNRPQQVRFVEQAIRSVYQAAPFNLPAEHFEAWQVINQPFRARSRN